MTAAYRDDLAYIHDAGFGGFAREAGPVLVDALRRAKFTDGLVIDLGCGSGILSRCGLRLGLSSVWGFDISEAMIALARRRVPRGEFRVESLLSAKLPRLRGRRGGRRMPQLSVRSGQHQARKLAKLFRRIHAALVPGGVFILDVAEPGRVPGPGPRRTYLEGNDWAVLVTSEEDRAAQGPDAADHQLSPGRRAVPSRSRGPPATLDRTVRPGAAAPEHRVSGAHPLRYGPLEFGPGHAGCSLASRSVAAPI